MMLKTLLWKDFRQQGKFLAVCGVILLVPYVVAVVSVIVKQMTGSLDWEWIEHLHAASLGDALRAFMLTAFVAGHAIAGERADRSAEFTAYLPIDRKFALLSKAITALGICVFLVTVTWIIAWLLGPPDDRGSSMNSNETVIYLSTVISLFAVAWLFSSFLRSPDTAAVIGLAFPICLATSCGLITGSESIQRTELFIIVSLAVSLPCLAGSVVYYLRRVEP